MQPFLVQIQFLGGGKLFEKSFSSPKAPHFSKTFEMEDNVSIFTPIFVIHPFFYIGTKKNCEDILCPTVLMFCLFNGELLGILLELLVEVCTVNMLDIVKILVRIEGSVL